VTPLAMPPRFLFFFFFFFLIFPHLFIIANWTQAPKTSE
jgi:NADH:ubiquinone oxidoreductase subunit 4 (subunit M)